MKSNIYKVIPNFDIQNKRSDKDEELPQQFHDNGIAKSSNNDLDSISCKKIKISYKMNSSRPEDYDGKRYKAQSSTQTSICNGSRYHPYATNSYSTITPLQKILHKMNNHFSCQVNHNMITDWIKEPFLALKELKCPCDPNYCSVCESFVFSDILRGQPTVCLSFFSKDCFAKRYEKYPDYFQCCFLKTHITLRKQELEFRKITRESVLKALIFRFNGKYHRVNRKMGKPDVLDDIIMKYRFDDLKSWAECKEMIDARMFARFQNDFVDKLHCVYCCQKCNTIWDQNKKKLLHRCPSFPRCNFIIDNEKSL